MPSAQLYSPTLIVATIGRKTRELLAKAFDFPCQVHEPRWFAGDMTGAPNDSVATENLALNGTDRR